MPLIGLSPRIRAMEHVAGDYAELANLRQVQFLSASLKTPEAPTLLRVFILRRYP